MRCPYCHHDDTAVKDSRTTDDHSAIKRRRICHECDCRFTTFERIQLREFVILKRNGHRVPFDRDKLARSVETALHKRSVDQDQIERVINKLIRRLETIGEQEIPTTIIGELVMESLVNLDAVAYVRFASVYQKFDAVTDFVHFISRLSTAPVDTSKKENI